MAEREREGKSFCGRHRQSLHSVCSSDSLTSQEYKYITKRTLYPSSDTLPTRFYCKSAHHAQRKVTAFNTLQGNIFGSFLFIIYLYLLVFCGLIGLMICYVLNAFAMYVFYLVLF